MVGIAAADAALLCQVQACASEAISHAALQSSPCFTLHAHSRAMLQVFEQVTWRGYVAGSRQGFCYRAATAAEVALEDEERSGGQYVGHRDFAVGPQYKQNGACNDRARHATASGAANARVLTSASTVSRIQTCAT